MARYRPQAGSTAAATLAAGCIGCRASVAVARLCGMRANTGRRGWCQHTPPRRILYACALASPDEPRCAAPAAVRRKAWEDPSSIFGPESTGAPPNQALPFPSSRCPQGWRGKTSDPRSMSSSAYRPRDPPHPDLQAIRTYGRCGGRWKLSPPSRPRRFIVLGTRAAPHPPQHKAPDTQLRINARLSSRHPLSLGRSNPHVPSPFASSCTL